MDFQIVSEASKTILKDSTTSNQIDNWHLTPLMTAADLSSPLFHAENQ